MRHLLISVSLAALVAAPTAALADRSDPAPTDLPSYITQAIDDSARADDKADDARRKPGAVLAFSQVKPGDTVVELIPGGGYWTRMFSQIVGAKGHVYEVYPTAVAKAHADSLKKLKQLAADPHYGNVTVVTRDADALSSLDIDPADLVFTAENLHDFNNAGMGHITPEQFGAEVRPLLKDGGVLLINDHVAAKGKGLSQTGTLHRIEPALVKQQIVEAGFVFDAASEALRNPEDTHADKVFDPAIRGKTDQFIYRFRKPAEAPTPAKDD